MKNAIVLLTAIFMAFFAGSSVSGRPDPPAQGMRVGASSALLNALKSPQAEMLSGWEEEGSEQNGAYIIFAQSRDGETTVKNVEALDTVYLLAAQPGEGEGLGQTIEFETDKTNKELYLLRYQLVHVPWLETAVFNPATLPNIDFQEAYKQVKYAASIDEGKIEIASIAIVYPLVAEYADLVVSFAVLREGKPYCEQWQYHVIGDSAGEVWQTTSESKCFFEMSTAYDAVKPEEYKLPSHLMP